MCVKHAKICYFCHLYAQIIKFGQTLTHFSFFLGGCKLGWCCHWLWLKLREIKIHTYGILHTYRIVPTWIVVAAPDDSFTSDSNKPISTMASVSHVQVFACTIKETRVWQTFIHVFFTELTKITCQTGNIADVSVNRDERKLHKLTGLSSELWKLCDKFTSNGIHIQIAHDQQCRSHNIECNTAVATV